MLLKQHKNINLLIYFFLLVTFYLLNIGSLTAQSFSRGTGNWDNNPTNLWATTGVGVASKTVPLTTDAVTVQAGNTITVNNGLSYTCTGLTINAMGILTFDVNSSIIVNGNLVVNGTLNFGAGSILTVTGTVSGTGIINMTNGGTFNIGGNNTSSGTFTAGTGTVVYNGTVAQTVRGTTYNNLTITGTNTKTLGAGATVGGNLSVSSGTFATGNNTLAVTGSATIDGTMTTGTGAISFANNFVNNGTFTAGTGVHTFSGMNNSISGSSISLSIPSVTISGTYTNTIPTFTISTALAGVGSLVMGTNTQVNYGGIGAVAPTIDAITNSPNTFAYNRSGGTQTIKGTTYHHLVVSGGSTKTLGADTSVNGDFNLVSMTSFNPAGFNFTVSGNSTITGTIADGTAAGTSNLNNVDLSGGTISGTVNGIINILGTLTMPTGNGSIGQVDLTVSGATTIANTRTLTISSASGSKTFNQITNNGTWTNSVNEAIEIRNGLTNNGTFTAGSGTYTFTTNSQTIDGSSAISFGGAVTIDGGITLTNNISNVAGLTIVGVLNGIDVTSTFENLTLLNYQNATQPMATGGFDVNAVGNTVNYNGSAAQIINTASTPFTTNYHHLSIGGSGNKSWVTSGLITTISRNINGNFTVTGGTFIGSSSNAAAFIEVGGNLIVSGGTLNLSSSTTNGGATINLQGNYQHTGGTIAVTGTSTAAVGSKITLNGTTAQTMTGGGTSSGGIIESNNPNGITLTNNVSVFRLQLTDGVIDTQSNTLSILGTNNDASATPALIAGSAFSSTNSILGRLSRRIPTSPSNTYIFPIKKGTLYYPLELLNITTSASSDVVAELFDSNPAGSLDVTLTAPLDNTKYWLLTTPAGFTSARVRLYEAGLNATKKIGISSTTPNGVYTSMGGTVVASHITSDISSLTNDTFYFSTAGAATISGTYDVGSSCTFAKLTDVASFLNNGVVTGDVVFELCNSYDGTSGETFPLVFNQFSESGMGAGTYTVTIRPALGVTGRVTSGNAKIIQFNGGDRFILDGRPAGVGTAKEWIVRSTSTTESTIEFINDATQITINYLIFESNSTTANGMFLFNTGTTTGNDNISVNHTVLRNRSDVATANPRLAVYTAGSSASIRNDNITFDACEFVNFFSTTNSSTHIIHVFSNTNNFTLKNSHVYQVAAHNMGGSAIYTRWITISGTNTDNITIEGNFFGGRAINCGGSAYRYFSATAGVRFGINHILSSMASGTTLTFQNNTIKNMQTDFNENISGSSNRWVFLSGSGKMVIKNNTFTNLRFSMSSNMPSVSNTSTQVIVYNGDGTGEITANVIEDTQFTSNVSVTRAFAFEGIRLSPASNGLVVSQNIIGSTSLANSVLVNSHTSANDLIAISAVNSNTCTITNNTIANLTNNSTNPSSTLYGINKITASNDIISSNTIYSLASSAQQANNSDNTTLAGIRLAINTTNILIHSNKIYTIEGTATTNSTSAGLLLTGGCNGHIYNNQIYDITNTSNTVQSIATGILVRNMGNGLYVYNNRISLGLAPLAGVATSNPDPAIYIGIWNNFQETTDRLYLIFNSVNIAGVSSGGAYRTFGFIRGDDPWNSSPDANLITTPLQVYNNIFQNERTGGTGTHYAISIQDLSAPDQAPCPSIVDEYAPDYNVYYASDASKMANAGGVDKDFANWKASFTPNIDVHSFDASPSVVPIAFIDVGVADMHLTVNDQRPDGKALPIATELGFPLTIDFDIDNEFRRSTDAGADELEQTMTFIGSSPNDNWHDPNNWLVVGSFPERNVVPNCADNVIIPSGKTVKVYNGGAENPTNEPALFYTLTIQNNATIELQNGTVMNSCWYNDELAMNQVHKGEFKNEAGGVFIANGGTLNIAGRFTDNGSFQKGTSTVYMNRDRPPLGLECLEKYIHARNDDSKISNISGTSNTNFHNLVNIYERKFSK
jgi:hypothetical protein